MGSTITVGKHVAAFRAADSAIYYALFEKTYSSNCFPQTPHWSCWHIGTLDSTLAKIFMSAACCEGGMLRGPSARMKPENYATHYLRLLRAPHALTDRRVTLTTGDSYRYAFSPASCGKGAAVFADAGLHDIAAEVAAGRTVAPDLYAYAHVLTRLDVPAWRMIDDDPREESETFPVLGYTVPAIKAPALPSPVVYKIGDEARIMPDAAGRWRCAGWAYDIVQAYVKAQATNPGGFRARIEAYRAAIEGAPQIPPGTTVTIDPPAKPWNWRSTESWAARMNGGAVFTAPAEEAIENCVDYIARDAVTWNLPGECIAIAAE